MPHFYVPPWKKAPFFRLLIALIAGIIVQWQAQINLTTLWPVLITCLLIIISFFFIPFFARYKLTWINGIVICILFFSLGALLAWYKDIRHNDRWFGKLYKENAALIVTLNEPTVEKTKSIKANAIVSFMIQNNAEVIPVQGEIILYFKKDSLLPPLGYGSQIIFKKSLPHFA